MIFMKIYFYLFSIVDTYRSRASIINKNTLFPSTESRTS